MPRRPTSRDVAVAAGVSQSTVSIVLTGKWPGRVSPHTAQSVREAAARLGYRPNLAARNLRLGQTRTVLLVVPTLANPFFGAVYTGAARVAAEHGFGVVVYPWPDGHGPARSPFSTPHEAIDGVLASSMATEVLSDLVGQDRDMGVPLVMLDSDPGGAAPTVNVDVAAGMRSLVDHLARAWASAVLAPRRRHRRLDLPRPRPGARRCRGRVAGRRHARPPDRPHHRRRGQGRGAGVATRGGAAARIRSGDGVALRRRRDGGRCVQGRPRHRPRHPR
jgi:DNA-binding LacI/PurR family transcriptional regulator